MRYGRHGWGNGVSTRQKFPMSAISGGGSVVTDSRGAVADGGSWVSDGGSVVTDSKSS